MVDVESGSPRESCALLLLGLYEEGVFGFEEVRFWAREAGLDEMAQRRLMEGCVRVHFTEPAALRAA